MEDFIEELRVLVGYLVCKKCGSIVAKDMRVVTLSEEEGNKILEFVKGAIHAGYRTTEPSVPEAVKDLGCTPEQGATLYGVYKEIAIRANNAIAEAYRRGLKGAK
jgi:hypothetical protein